MKNSTVRYYASNRESLREYNTITAAEEALLRNAVKMAVDR